MKEHECRESRTCTCYLLADEPNENCPIHGAGPWPPKCEICGRFMKWETRIVNKLVESYENGECPDCGEPIPATAVAGDDCKNCGHVFWSTMKIKENVILNDLTRSEYCIAQSAIAAIRNISTMYECNGDEDEIHVGDSRDRILAAIRKSTAKSQRENAFDILKSLVQQDQ